MQPPEPVLVVDLFPREREALLDVLRSLTADDWERPTVCPGWSVHDIGAHLVGDDLGRLSRGRDGYSRTALHPGEDVVEFVNRQNEQWVAAWRRVSPSIIVGMLDTTGRLTQEYFESLDAFAMGGSVWWATGDDPAPVWLDVAREFTERWHHHAQIRDAVSAPPLDDPAILRPVIATFAHALPRTFRDVDRSPGTAVTLTVTGSSGGSWSLVREEGAWRLMIGAAEGPAATVSIDQDTYWRLVTKGVTRDVAASRARLQGQSDLALRVLESVAIIA
jgi:uncharacterized protein (TIGR03083 family)